MFTKSAIEKVRKEQGSKLNLDALFYGQAGMLDKEFLDEFPLVLKRITSFCSRNIHLSLFCYLPGNFADETG
ncbi:MAG: DUF2851 family protein [Bacteroidetes bacterium]|nr:DUF2851 family protein [Bacteroidota bacterium]